MDTLWGTSCKSISDKVYFWFILLKQDNKCTDTNTCSYKKHVSYKVTWLCSLNGQTDEFSVGFISRIIWLRKKQTPWITNYLEEKWGKNRLFCKSHNNLSVWSAYWLNSTLAYWYIQRCHLQLPSTKELIL